MYNHSPLSTSFFPLYPFISLLLPSLLWHYLHSNNLRQLTRWTLVLMSTSPKPPCRSFNNCFYFLLLFQSHFHSYLKLNQSRTSFYSLCFYVHRSTVGWSYGILELFWYHLILFVRTFSNVRVTYSFCIQKFNCWCNMFVRYFQIYWSKFSWLANKKNYSQVVQSTSRLSVL